MKITLYTTHCPMCRMLEARLNNAKINYDTCTDKELMLKMGFMSVPMLQVDDKILTLREALKWVEEQQ